MAGDWIKMRASLCTHPKVGLIADIIGESTDIGKRLSTGFKGCLDEIVTRDVTRDITIASLLRVWCATNEHTRDGVWQHSTLRSIDTAAGIEGFAEAMELAGWLVVDEEAGTVTMPNFLEYNSPAKGGARSPAAVRQHKYRENMKAKRDEMRDVTRDVTVTPREEKRREEKKDKEEEAQAPSDLPDWIPMEAWAGYLDMRKKIRKTPTDRAVKLLVKSLSEMRAKGVDIAQALDNSTRQNWTDVYEPKGTPAKASDAFAGAL